jgi:beta-glucosidase/6-phospho-beta-glucosidase/beta-galactosidase
VWKTTDMGWGVHPEGMRKMLNYIQKEFNPRGGIIITGVWSDSYVTCYVT